MLLIVTMITLTTGCFKRDDMEGIQIYTTVYHITYIIDELYGNYATISSIYPNGVNIDNYELTDKQINDYSKGNLFIYNGLSNEKEIARKFLNKNKDMKHNKYSSFELTVKDGSKIMVKAVGPNKVTEKYAMVLAADWVNFRNKIGFYDDNALKSDDIIGIKGIS